MAPKKERSSAKADVNRGAWTAEEDEKLVKCVQIYGERRWQSLPSKAGLKRNGKSCRLRWLNYLRPNIKRGNISDQEEDLIIRLHKLLGNRWSLIARRLPGRTDNEIKNYWNSHLSKKLANPDEKKSSDLCKTRGLERDVGVMGGDGPTLGKEGQAIGEEFEFDVDEFFDFSRDKVARGLLGSFMERFHGLEPVKGSCNMEGEGLFCGFAGNGWSGEEEGSGTAAPDQD